MDTQPKLARIQSAFMYLNLVVVLRSVVVNAFRRLDQKPNQIQQKRTDKVENDLIYKVTSHDASEIINHAADHFLYTKYKWQNGPLNSIKKTHNSYSTTRREKYKCLDKPILSTFLLQMQLSGNVFPTSAPLEGEY
jgi:hypothetical protein